MHRIASLDVDNVDDIDWKSLSDPAWNMWSGHFLRQKWRQLKASCNADGIMCHRGEYITSILFSLPPHVLDRRRTSSLNPGLCGETNVCAHSGHVHTFYVSYLLKYLKGPWRYKMVTLVHASTFWASEGTYANSWVEYLISHLMHLQSRYVTRIVSRF